MSDYTELIQKAEAAIAMAEAHQLEARAPQYATWRDVQRGWELARAKTETLDILYGYCHTKVKEAYKQASFKEAQSERDPLFAEQILYALCEDDFLDDDWEVWYRHAKQCLDTVARWIERDDDVDHINTFMQKARDSQIRAARLSDGEVKVERLQQKLADWQRIVTAIQMIRQHLKNEPLKAVDCQNAIQAHKNVAGLSAHLQSVFNRLWQKLRQRACLYLRTQFQESDEAVAQIDSIIALKLLCPKDNYVDQLDKIAKQAVDKLVQVSQALLNDDSGQRTVRYLQRTIGNSPEPATIAQRQATLVSQLRGQVDTLRYAIDQTASADDGAPLQQFTQRLNQLDSELARWYDAIYELATQLDEVARLGEIGLTSPKQLDEAEYILRTGTGDGTQGQIAVNFTNHNHISVGHYRDYVARQRERLNRQKGFKSEIIAGLADEKLAFEAAQRIVTAQEPDHADLDLIAQAVNILELVVRNLQKMKTDDPHDLCQLQGTLAYNSPDDNRFYQGLPNIQKAVDDKLQQQRDAEMWLAHYTIERGDIVSWDAARNEIERLREKGKRSIAAALWFTKAVRGEGRVEAYSAEWTENFPFVTQPASRYGTISTNWHPGNSNEDKLTLAQAVQLLAKEQLMGQLESADTTRSGLSGLYAITIPIEHMRQKREDVLKNMIDETEKLVSNLQWRWEEYDGRWSAVEAAYVDILSTRRNVLRSKAWKRFQSARDRFCQICCQDSNFIELIRELHIRKDIPLTLSECVCE